MLFMLTAHAECWVLSVYHTEQNALSTSTQALSAE